MPDLLLELFSEEIPARMQVRAAKDLERLLVGALSDYGMLFEWARSFAGPRRLTVAIGSLPAKQPDRVEEKKGPRVDAPEKALQGFLKSAGVTLEQCQQRKDDKGAYYVATISRKGRPTMDVLAESIPDVISRVPWPKSMRWGSGSFRWVRPLHSIVAVFDGEVVKFEIAELRSGNVTRGHRFLAPQPIEVRHLEDYEKKLRRGFVIVDHSERRERIMNEATQKAFAIGLEPAKDDALLDELAGLAEWPSVLIGTIAPEFMELPQEILQLSMRTHQKYLALRDAKSGKFADRFAMVTNMMTADGGKQIIKGNERVLRPRLSDAKFFWNQDRKRTLESRLPALKQVVFHAKLGSQFDRVQRITALATELARVIGANTELCRRAATLCKSDLMTEMVGEFPELQGVMGRYYALNDGEPEQVATAILEHYKPAGPSDSLPSTPVSIVVALADKLDMLTGLFALGEKPTGSGDPYGLRRAALGIIRIVLENGLRLRLIAVLRAHLLRYAETLRQTENRADAVAQETLAFFVERLEVALRERGARHDLIQAVFSLTGEDDLVLLVRRVEALQQFVTTDDGANLLVGYRRAANILRIEEKKDGRTYRGIPEQLQQEEEQELHAALVHAKVEAAKSLSEDDFAGAMTAFARLRTPVDRFFDRVTVNTTDAALRVSRLKLLSQIVETAHQVADFSKIEG
jgi:glycyl-tRNA synthetase beta chain